MLNEVLKNLASYELLNNRLAMKLEAIFSIF